MIWGWLGDFQWAPSISCILVVHWWFCINTRVLILEKNKHEKVNTWCICDFLSMSVWVLVKRWCGGDESKANSLACCTLCVCLPAVQSGAHEGQSIWQFLCDKLPTPAGCEPAFTSAQLGCSAHLWSTVQEKPWEEMEGSTDERLSIVETLIYLN